MARKQAEEHTTAEYIRFQFSIGDTAEISQGDLGKSNGDKFQFSIGDASRRSPRTSSAYSRVFQFSIGDAQGDNGQGVPPDVGQFQFSIGDASRPPRRAPYTSTPVSILHWRCEVVVNVSPASRVCLFQFSIGDAGLGASSRHGVRLLVVSILHWRCLIHWRGVLCSGVCCFNSPLEMPNLN